MSKKIRSLFGREVLDSRGNPTVEVELELEDNSVGQAIVPSGASTGIHEALELRDKDPKRFCGKGVLSAIQNVNGTIREGLVGKSFQSQKELDDRLLQLDGTEQKSKLGANAILGVSLAFAHASARQQTLPLFQYFNQQMGLESSVMSLPVPLMNIVNGGEHANNALEVQEFMIVPHGFGDFRSALRAGCEVFHSLKKKLDEQGHSTAVGDEGGFAPNLNSNTEAIEYVCRAIESAGYRPGEHISLALDVASSSFYDKEKGDYRLKRDGKERLSANELMEYYGELFNQFPIVSVEDGLDEQDWEGWKTLTQRFGERCQLVGDDLFVTNPKFVQKGIELGVANAVLVKVNQIGSLSETLDTMNLCRQKNYACVVSHRSGETEDTTISHLAVGSGAGQIKTGSLSRGERTAKYNELLRISDWAERKKIDIKFAKPF